MHQPTIYNNPVPPEPKEPLWKPVVKVMSVLLITLALCYVALPYVARMIPHPAAMRTHLGYRSEAEAEEALLQNPIDAPAHMTIAKAAQKRHDKVLALHEWQEAARFDPDNSAYQMALAFELLNQQKHKQARPILEAVAKKKDGSAPVAARLLSTLSYYKTKPAPPPAPDSSAPPTGKSVK